ncbi:ABC transporter permease [Aquisphaera insulae]|uniref:ABC transporter permease n=1 Tax=Aquisphaera insulae TaxID=2712864 RepID=UPI0013ECA8B2|nr:ABC transporter permease [Aquisphaera insulae]
MPSQQRSDDDANLDEGPETPQAVGEAHESPEIVLRARTGWIAIDWEEMYAFRELFFFLIWRDISARYKQTVLGSAWAVLQPLIMMLVFCFLAFILKIPTPEVNGKQLPYPVFVFAGLIPWMLFSQGMPAAALSLLTNQHLLTKVYFPRLFLPLTAATVYLVDMAYATGIYAVILTIYRIPPAWTIVFLPLLILVTLIGTLGIGTILASLTLFYRDFRHIIPFLVQFMMYATPVFYAAPDMSKHRWFGYLLSLNPMYGIIDAYRAVILGAPLNATYLLISSISGLALLVFGLFYFRRTERRFADFA